MKRSVFKLIYFADVGFVLQKQFVQIQRSVSLADLVKGILFKRVFLIDVAPIFDQMNNDLFVFIESTSVMKGSHQVSIFNIHQSSSVYQKLYYVQICISFTSLME